MKGNNFIPIGRQDTGSLSGPNNHDVKILDAAVQVPKISNTAQFVIFRMERISVDKILHIGHTIPCDVQFDQSDRTVYISRNNNVSGQFESINGETPLKYSPRLFMQTSRILDAQENESFVFGRYENTEWKEYTITANHRFFIYSPRYRDRDFERWNFEIERTKNGYFKVNFTQKPVGYCCINGNVILEFVNATDESLNAGRGVPHTPAGGGETVQPPHVPQRGDRARQLFGTPNAP